SAILGQGQMSLAKYLLIANRFDDEGLKLHNIPAFFKHLLSRIDWRRDLHFHTCTTIDTLDYSGDGFNIRSKVVMSAVGRPIRELATELSSDLRLPHEFSEPRVALPGILVVQAKADSTRWSATLERSWSADLAEHAPSFPLIVVVDDSDFAARSLNNLLW